MAGDNIDKVMNSLKTKTQAAIRTMPKVLGNEAVVWTKQSWDRQGWLDESTEGWAARQKNTRRNNGKAILVQTGRLRRSIRILSEGENRVVIGTDVPYARIHNYGGTITQAARSETFQRNRITRGARKGRFKRGVTAGRGFSFSQRNIVMPKRQFAGNSYNLRLRLYIVGKNHLAQKLK